MKTIVAAAVALIVAIVTAGHPRAERFRDQDSRAAPADPLRLPGYKTYVRQCAPCHGERGDGKGVAAKFLDPPPRDFKQESFAFVSTANGAPSSKDLFETIATGIGGTAMIPFAFLGEDEIWPVIDVVLAFREQGIRTRLAEAGMAADAIESEVGRRRAVLLDTEAAEPPETQESAARGLIHYRAVCASCHGVDGRGVAPATVPAGARRVVPRDFTRGILKQLPIPRNLFQRIRCGMPGTAMPSTPAMTLDTAKAWELVHYLRTMIPSGAAFLASADTRELPAARLAGPAPESPDDPRFDGAPRTWIAFAPFRDAEPGPPGMFVEALAAERLIAFRFTIPDPTKDVPTVADDSPPDGIAVRVTATDKPPVLPFPGQPPRLDRAVYLTGTLPDGKSAIYDRTPKFENPENVCRMVQPPDRAGAGEYRQGAWRVALAVRTEESGSPTAGSPFWVSFAPFDGSLRRGPMPVGFSAWQKLVVK